MSLSRGVKSTDNLDDWRGPWKKIMRPKCCNLRSVVITKMRSFLSFSRYAEAAGVINLEAVLVGAVANAYSFSPPPFSSRDRPCDLAAVTAVAVV